MDPEEILELQQSITELNRVLVSQTTALSKVIKSFDELNKANEQNKTSTTRNTTANNDSTAGISKKEETDKKAAETIKEVSGNLQKGFNGARSALDSFSKAVLSNQAGFEKYGSTVSSLGEAAWNVGKNFGIFGKLLGGLSFAIGKATEAGFKQADGLLKGIDDLSEIGAAGQITSDEMYKMGHRMGLNSHNLQIFTKTANTLSGSLISLGLTAGDGIKELGNLVSVTTKQRNAFQRLGVSQEELMQRQTDYIQLQLKSGMAISKKDIADGTLQRLSLEYAKDLSVIAAATSQNAKEAQADQERAHAATNIQIHQAKLQAQMDDESLPKAQREAAERQLLIENQKLTAAAATKDPRILAAYQEKLATGAYGPLSSVLLRAGVNEEKIDAEANKLSIEELRKQKLAGDITAGLTHELAEATKRNNKNLGTVATFNKDFAEGTLQSSEMQINAAKLGKETLEQTKERYRLAREKTGNPEDGTTNAQTDQDPAQVARNNLTNMEIYAGQTVDDLVKSMNPLLGNTGALKALAVAATGVAAILTAAILFRGKKGGGGTSGITGGLMGMLGGSGGGLMGILGRKKITTEAVQEGEKALVGKAANGAADVGLQNLNKAANSGGGVAGGFLKGIVEGLALAGKPPTPAYIVLGAGAIGAAITAIGAGLAGATWVMGKAMPSLANGLKAFDKLNGPNLKQVGIGMAGLGAGILAMGSGQIVGAVGNIMQFFTGNTNPIQKVSTQVIELQQFNFDKTKVQNNSDALVAFAKAMAATSSLGTLGTLAEAGGAIAGGISKFFGGKPPIDQFTYFSNLKIDAGKANSNSTAFIAFANAMSAYKGGPGLIDTISSLAGAGFNKIFGGDGPVEAFGKFAKMDFGSKAKDNADAFYKYAQSANMLAAKSGGGNNSLPNSGEKPAGGGENASGGGFFGGIAQSFQSGGKSGASAAGSIIGATGSLSQSAIEFGKSIYNRFIGKTEGVDPNTLQKFGKVQGALGNKSIYVTSGARPEGWITPKGTISGKNNPHVVKRALDLGITGDQTAVVQSAIRAGFTGIGGEGNHIHIDDSHPQLTLWGADYTAASTPAWLKRAATMKARDGGIFSNTVDEPGVPSMPTGKKLAPLKLDSLLMKLARTNVESLNQIKTMNALTEHTQLVPEDQGMLNLELYNMINHKLDHVLTALDNSHNTQSKILKYSMS
jgi:hypothetical protein